MERYQGQEKPAESTIRTESFLLRISVLGPFHIKWVGQTAPFPPERLQGRGAAPALGLLKALLCRPNRFASRDWLMEQFWPESSRSKAEERLDDVASGLRSLLRPPGSQAKILHFVYGSNGRGSGYRLEGYPQIWVDADAFCWYVEHAVLMDRFGQDSLAIWEQAYQLASRGTFLPEESYSDWAQSRRELLEGYYRQCTHRLAHLLREARADEEAMLRLRTYWQQYPTDEDALRPLLEVLGTLERYQEAEQYYLQAQEALQQENREPDRRTQDVIEYIRTRPILRERTGRMFAIPSGVPSPLIVTDVTILPSNEARQDVIAPNTEVLSKPLLGETRHLIGREEWLSTVLQTLQALPPKKIIVLQGPIGVGKTSELNRLARHFMSPGHSSYHVIWIPMLSGERVGGPEAALDVFLGILLNENNSPVPSDASRQMLTSCTLSFLEQQREPMIILLDNAECLLTERGMLAPCWDTFLAQFLRCHHQATLILATKEWRGWSGRDGLFVAEITVPPLTLQESVFLLQRLGLEAVPVQYLRAMSERVACIPLCLEWSAKLACDPLLLDDWRGFESAGETGEQDILGDMTQRIVRLLEEPSLLGGHLATQLAPLLQQIIERHLSNEARGILEKLAVFSIPLGKPALQALCPRPGLLKELRDASLLASYANRVQLLPMVASTIRQYLSPNQIYEMEELAISALMCWLNAGSFNDREAGSVIAELALLQLMHHRLLDAAQLLIRYGWLSFQQGYTLHLARLVQRVLGEFDWRATPETESGGNLLQYYMLTYLGLKIEDYQRIEAYQRILAHLSAGRVTVEPLMEVHLLHIVMLSSMNEDRFEQAQEYLRACFSRMKTLLATDLELHIMLLSKQAWLFWKWSDSVASQSRIDEARSLSERGIEIYQQCIHLLQQGMQKEGTKPLLKISLKNKLATFSNNLSMLLNRMRRFEEALLAVEQSIELKEQGFTDFGALAASYGEKSQTLAELGQFREALHFDEKARAEVQRCADMGDTASQEEVWIYQVNQGRLYLRLGRIEEAEPLLHAAEPHIAARRKVYRTFAQEALMEIEQMRHSSHPHQLDWRWVERYRELDAFDAYWWWAHAGPFTEEEQQQWDRLFSTNLDEATKNQLGGLLVRSRDREVEAALTEHREPHLRYPALDIEEVQRRIAGLQQLDAEIQRDEPNAIVRRLYHGAIEEELCFIRLFEATYDGESERFWTLSRQLNEEPTREEMNYALSRVRQVLSQGLQRPDAIEVTEQVIQILHEQLHLSLDLSPGNGLVQPEHKEMISSSDAQHIVSAQAAKRFFETTLQEGGFDGWHVVLDPNSGGARVDSALKTVFLQDNPMSLETIRDYFAHELLGHVLRSVAGEHSTLGLLGMGTKDYMSTEEGLANYYERTLADRHGEAFNDSGTWLGTLAVGLASGVMTTPQTFSSLFAFFEPFLLLYSLLWRNEKDLQRAHKRALVRCLRTFRGVPDLKRAGVCYTKDAVYLRGWLKIEQAVAQDETVLDRLSVGKVALELLPDMQELGIVTSIKSLRKRASDPDLDDYILSFEVLE
ncbi:MAG TPA: tyrosine/phenylalanine carboxypeptidase domain-containing protein [Ktedonobacteraceae bacterium]|nr:tyrosine/phenylalanine carboxypeptidase domain-containing protein [Ktedonobacteraceae bacterium]